MALMLVGFLLAAETAVALPPNPYEYVLAGIDQPLTVDPAKAYDTTSCELIYNVYETLVDFNGSSTSEYVPELATSWLGASPSLIGFQIRKGVRWQNATYGFVNASDIEYSLKRVMVRDYANGPGWMLYQPLLGMFTANDTGRLTNPPNLYTLLLGQAIDAAITSDDVAMTVTIRFATGLPYPSFLSILAQTWASVMSKQWCIDHGDWPGIGLDDGSWVNWHDPGTSPLDEPTHIMMGSGPYKLDYFNSIGWSIIKFDDYWGGWGNPRRGFRARGYLVRVTEYFVPDWATRLAGFLGSAAMYDSIYVPRPLIGQVWQQAGVKCIYPSKTLSLDAMFFTYDVGPNSPYIGDGQWGETGIIPEFFSDVHVRRAIAYSFPWTAYIDAAWWGEAKQIPVPVPEQLKFYNLTPWGYTLPENYTSNGAQAAAEWAQAWGGLVTSNGFYFVIVFDSDIPATIAVLLKNTIESQGSNFHVDVVVGSSSQLHSPLNDGRSIMPVFVGGGWRGDFPDVHNFVGSFMGSWGYFGKAQNINLDPYSAYIDELIEWGLHNTTDAGRAYNYNQTYYLYHEQVPSVPLAQAQCRRWERDWVHGWYYNPLFSGSDAAYIGESVKSNFYSMWKEDMTTTTGPYAGKYANWEDIDANGKVEIWDLATGAKAFGAYYIQPRLPPNPSGPPGVYSRNWNSKADVNKINPIDPNPYTPRGDMKVDVKDLAAIAKLFGFVADPWEPPP